VSNTGVTSIVAGTNVSVSGATGAVTVNAPAYGTTITASTIGGTAAAGTSTGVAREDHKHAFPAGAAPSALTVSSTQATGTSTAPALADHVHAMPGSAIAGASAVGDTAATGTATTVALSDHRHSREAFGTPGAVTGGATAASGSASTLARSDHVHSTASMPVLLASTTLSSTTAEFTWSSISSSYSSLYILFGARITGSSGAFVSVDAQFNGDTGANYCDDWGSPTFTATKMWIGLAHSTANSSTATSCNTVTILHANAARYKAIGGLYSVNNSTTSGSWGGLTGALNFRVWQSTATISSIRIFNRDAWSFASGSTFQLYGYP
jgi:hypothetical protein